MYTHTYVIYLYIYTVMLSGDGASEDREELHDVSLAPRSSDNASSTSNDSSNNNSQKT